MGSSSVCLELANTSVGEPADRGDLLATPAGLARWLGSQRRALGEPSEALALRGSEFRSLREAIRGLLEALVAGGSLPPEAVARVNAASASAPTWVELDPRGPAGAVMVRTGVAVGRTVEIMALIARDAIELVGSTGRERLRRCPAPRCGRFFLEERRGTVWCSPACGNRVRVARHHARARAGGAGAGTEQPSRAREGEFGRG